jgi:hypothetical protein
VSVIFCYIAILSHSIAILIGRLLWATCNRREQIASWNSQKICKQSLWVDYKKDGSTNPVAQTAWLASLFLIVQSDDLFTKPFMNFNSAICSRRLQIAQSNLPSKLQYCGTKLQCCFQGGGGGGGGMNRFSDRRISQKKLFGFWIWRIFYTDLPILLIQRIADLSNVLARIVNLTCNLVRILDCDVIVELLADSNLDNTIIGSRILLQICADRRICIPLFTPPSPCKRTSGLTVNEIQAMFGINKKLRDQAFK